MDYRRVELGFKAREARGSRSLQAEGWIRGASPRARLRDRERQNNPKSPQGPFRYSYHSVSNVQEPLLHFSRSPRITSNDVIVRNVQCGLLSTRKHRLLLYCCNRSRVRRSHLNMNCVTPSPLQLVAAAPSTTTLAAVTVPKSGRGLTLPRHSRYCSRPQRRRAKE